jgi:hypothetical protein
MSSEIIYIVTWNSYDDFQYLKFIFSYKIISIFQGLNNEETNVRYYVSFALLLFTKFSMVACHLLRWGVTTIFWTYH